MLRVQHIRIKCGGVAMSESRRLYSFKELKAVSMRAWFADPQLEKPLYLQIFERPVRPVLAAENVVSMDDF